MCIVASRAEKVMQSKPSCCVEISGVSEIKIEIKARSSELSWISVNTGVIPDKVSVRRNF